MMVRDGDDPMLRHLEGLRPLRSDAARAERVRARCRAQLGRRRRRLERAALCAESARRVLTPVVVGGLCVLYMAALVGTAIRLGGPF